MIRFKEYFLINEVKDSNANVAQMMNQNIVGDATVVI